MKRRSCEECKFFWCESYGDNWHEPRQTEYGCSKEDEDPDTIEKYLNQYEEHYNKETKCPHYDAGICESCGEPIGKEYVFWASGSYSDFKCCSEACRKEKNNEADWPFV